MHGGGAAALRAHGPELAIVHGPIVRPQLGRWEDSLHLTPGATAGPRMFAGAGALVLSVRIRPMCRFWSASGPRGEGGEKTVTLRAQEAIQFAADAQVFIEA